MNRTAVNGFHLKCTSFTNPHGLADKGNHSTAFDIAMLAFNALKDNHFRDIVNKQKHECITYLKRRHILTKMQVDAMMRNEILQHQLDEEIPYRMVWQNSNKLLGIEGFKGVKTGIT